MAFIYEYTNKYECIDSNTSECNEDVNVFLNRNENMHKIALPCNSFTTTTIGPWFICLKAYIFGRVFQATYFMLFIEICLSSQVQWKIILFAMLNRNLASENQTKIDLKNRKHADFGQFF